MYKFKVSFDDGSVQYYIYDQMLPQYEQVVVNEYGSKYIIGHIIDSISFDPVVDQSARWIVSRIDDSQYLARKEESRKAEELNKLKQEETELALRLTQVQEKINIAEAGKSEIGFKGFEEF